MSRVTDALLNHCTELQISGLEIGKTYLLAMSSTDILIGVPQRQDTAI